MKKVTHTEVSNVIVLKSQVYDLIAQKEKIEGQIRNINGKILQLSLKQSNEEPTQKPQEAQKPTK